MRVDTPPYWYRERLSSRAERAFETAGNEATAQLAALNFGAIFNVQQHTSHYTTKQIPSLYHITVAKEALEAGVVILLAPRNQPGGKFGGKSLQYCLV